MSDITLDVPTPPSVNRLRRIDWASYGGYKRWQTDADKCLVLHKQHQQKRITSKYQIIIEIEYDTLRADPDNLIKACLDYAVSRELVPDDNKKFLVSIVLRFSEDSLPEGCRVILRQV